MNPEEDPTAGDGRVLSPEELELADKDGVEEIEDGRYVVSPDGDQPDIETAPSASEGSVQPTPPDPSGDQLDQQEQNDTQTLDTDTVQAWTEQQLLESPTEFGYHISMKSEGEVTHHTLYSDDITTTFNNLLLWYARTIDRDMPPGAVLGILLSEANVPIKYPVKSFEEFLIEQGLSTDDTIADLLAAVRDDQEFEFPPK